MAKKVFELAVILLLAGCSVKPVNRKTTDPVKPVSVSPAVETPKSEPETVAPPVQAVDLPPVISKVLPKIGIIFSGGGAKAWGHIGVLREIEKSKWPVFAVAGFEWGAAVAALYAQNLSSNELEWELSKVKDFDNLEETSTMLFNRKSVGDLKIPFVCSSLNISKQAVFLLNRGSLSKLIPFCVAHPPVSPVYAQSVAEMSDVPSLAQHLRATGANKIVLINVLAQQRKSPLAPGELSAENILWVQAAALMARKVPGVDDIISINLDEYSLKDLDNRREIIAKGAEKSYIEIKKITGKYGL